MNFTFKFLVDDDVFVKSSKLNGKIVQRKVTITDSGFKTYHSEVYQIKYVTRAYKPMEWIDVDKIELDKEESLDLLNPYEVLSVIIDANLLQGYRNDDMVRIHNEMRNNL